MLPLYQLSYTPGNERRQRRQRAATPSTNADLRFRLRNVQQKLSCALSFQPFRPAFAFALQGLQHVPLTRDLAVDLHSPIKFGEGTP